MIGSFALLAALLATTPPRPPAQPEEPELDLDVHEIGIPDVDFSELRTELRSLEKLRHLDLSRLRLLAARDPDEEDEEQDAGATQRERARRDRERQVRDAERLARDAEQQAREEERNAREEERRARDEERRARERERWRGRFGSDDEDSEEAPRARATGKNGVASLAVKGPVTFRLRVQSGEVEVVPSEKPQIALSVDGVPVTGDVQILQFGDRVEAEFNGRRQLRRGRLRVELPKGSHLDFASTSGDISVQNLGGDVRVRTMSGDVKVEGARNADVDSVSGDARVNATGPRVRLHLVSGTAMATTADPAVQLAFQSASGNLEWTGVCAKGCHLSAETVSGEIKLQPDPAKSSFELSYSSHSGDLRDELKLEVKRAPKRKHGGMGGWLEAVYGKGEGVIECDAFSGDLVVRRK
jgi:Putative adhesin